MPAKNLNSHNKLQRWFFFVAAGFVVLGDALYAKNFFCLFDCLFVVGFFFIYRFLSAINTMFMHKGNANAVFKEVTGETKRSASETRWYDAQLIINQLVKVGPESLRRVIDTCAQREFSTESAAKLQALYGDLALIFFELDASSVFTVPLIAATYQLECKKTSIFIAWEVLDRFVFVLFCVIFLKLPFLMHWLTRCSLFLLVREPFNLTGRLTIRDAAVNAAAAIVSQQKVLETAVAKADAAIAAHALVDPRAAPPAPQPAVVSSDPDDQPSYKLRRGRRVDYGQLQNGADLLADRVCQHEELDAELRETVFFGQFFLSHHF
jgi:hypothetical protein